ncbi:unnamed protein product [Adineta steineri]|uniref:Tripeptidyl-peptidase 1 n=1 Tax=Adineta steineri TaxID=433720 RepID=A0A819U2T8_9BILA|nr:unnamed protein product [Adineta steineri]CAF4087876.1 unnamed protein product [Adineta steineri]
MVRGEEKEVNQAAKSSSVLYDLNNNHHPGWCDTCAGRFGCHACATFGCHCPTTPGQVPSWLTLVSDSPDPNEPITFFMVLKQDQKAVKKLENILWEITNPDSSKYQNWLSRWDIDAILTLNDRVLTAVKHWLWKKSFISTRFIGTDVVEIMATIQQVQELFSVQFRTYKHFKTGKIIHRTHDDICLTDEINQHVDFWVGLSDDPFTNSEPTDPPKKRIVFTNDGNTIDAKTTEIDPIVVPQFIIPYYNSPDVSKTGLESHVSQGSLQFAGEYYNPTDLLEYLELMNISSNLLKPEHILGINDPSNPGLEAMLDVEQMVGINPLAETWFFNDDVKNISSDGIFIKMLSLNQLDYLSRVLSISYAYLELGLCAGVTSCDEKVLDLSNRYFIRTDIEIMKLTMRGITVLVASGDDGANSAFADCTNTKLYPYYPASSPFVTSVGATTLVNAQYKVLQDQPPICTLFNPPIVCVSGGDEIAVSVNDPLFVDFTSGGGFSNIFSQPSYQKDVVNHYFRNEQHYVNKAPEYYPPSSMYNRYGRAYPDVAALGVNAAIVVDDSLYLEGGTSMSSPLWAGIVSILNSRSIKITGKTLGFLNPLLYKMAKECPECLKDITVGNNKCTRTVCTDQCKGFQAACGWDPVTGLGTPNVGNILKYITKLLKKKMNKAEYN